MFLDIPGGASGETTEILRSMPGLRVERIVSRGHHSPEDFWYDQEEHEWVIVLAGKAQLMFEGGEVVEMSAGDYVDIPAHRKHRVEWTDPERDTIWLAVYSSPSPSV